MIIALMLAYLVVILILLRILGGKKAFARPLQVWLEGGKPKG